MTTETPASQATDVALARELARVAKTRRLLKRSIWALAVVFVGTMAVLAGTLAEVLPERTARSGNIRQHQRRRLPRWFLRSRLALCRGGPPAPQGQPATIVSAATAAGRLVVSLPRRGTVTFWLALAGHTALVSGAAFSPDGSRVVTASWDGTARVWDAKTGGVLITLAGHRSWADSAVFSPDGGRILTASWDKTARVWDAKTGAVLATFSGHADHVNGAAFSPDGSRVITAGNDNTARIWDAKTGAALVTLSGHAAGVNAAIFSPDGSRTVTASFDDTARIWNAETGAALATLSGHTSSGVERGLQPRWHPCADRIGRQYRAGVGRQLGRSASYPLRT